MRLTQALDELVTANRILAREGVVDSFGHVSIRHPDRPDRYILSRARAPECIEVDDLMEFTSDGAPIDPSGRTWDSRARFGDTNLLVTSIAMGRDLAAALGSRSVILMRGHGAVVAGP